MADFWVDVLKGNGLLLRRMRSDNKTGNCGFEKKHYFCRINLQQEQCELD